MEEPFRHIALKVPGCGDRLSHQSDSATSFL
jgi:hypothetical protein